MRRSLAPSQICKLKEAPKAASDCITAAGPEDDDSTIIQRLPLFGFLEIPKELNKQFKVPSGCVLSEK
jgi:hypothetical protein